MEIYLWITICRKMWSGNLNRFVKMISRKVIWSNHYLKVLLIASFFFVSEEEHEVEMKLYQASLSDVRKW